MDHDHADPAAAGALHHVELNVADFDGAVGFWDWLLGEFGYEPKNGWDGGQSWIKGPTYVVLDEAETSAHPVERRAPGLDHLAFHAASRDQVDSLTTEIRARDDATLLYEDQHPYAGGYYALYCEAPAGITVEVVGSGVASWNAYWNDGLLLNWLLVGSFVTPWLIHYNLRLGIYNPLVSAGYVTLALLVSTVGYLLGVGVRRVSRGGPDNNTDRPFAAVFDAPAARTTRRFLILGGVLVVSAGLVAAAEPYRRSLLSLVYPVVYFHPVGTVTSRTLLGCGIVVGWTAVATWPAARGRGLLTSWAVLLAPMLGVYLAYTRLETFFGSGLTASVLDDVAIAILAAVTVAVILGSVGFACGVVIRWSLDRRAEQDERTTA